MRKSRAREITAPRSVARAAGNLPAGPAVATLGAMAATSERRQGRRDRRDPSRPGVPPGPERRQNAGCRRRLPEPRWRRWPSIAAAAALGVVTAFALQALQADASAVESPAPIVRTPAPRASVPAGPAITLAEAQALHDEAAALTPAGVAIDERAHAIWLPRLGRLEAAARDPRMTPEVRDALGSTLEALAGVGIGGGRP